MSALSTRKLRQAQERLRDGDFAGAEILCEDILRNAPRNPDALFMLGGSRIALGRAADAVPPLKLAISADPRHGAALEHLGLAHLMLGEYPDAERALRAAAALPRAPASVFMRLGSSMLHQARPVEAVAALQRALVLDPQDADSHLTLGLAFAQSGDVAAARSRFETALALSPGHVGAMFNLGVMDLDQDAMEDAGKWFERVLSRQPRNIDAHINLGLVLQKQQRLDDAIASFNKALSLDPSNAKADNNLARTLALQGKLEQAREHYLAALRAAPGFVSAHEGLAYVCASLGYVGEAVTHFRVTVEAEPANSNAMSALAGALFEAGELEQAEATARRACELSPSAPAAYATLANVHVVRGELDHAIATLQSGYAASEASSLLGMLAHQLRQVCDWTGGGAAWERMALELGRSAALGSPFWLLAEPTTAEQQLEYTRNWAQARFGPIAPAARVATAPRDRARIRVGYLSSDLQEHAAAYLIAEVLELHDRDRFEVFAYSYGPDDHSPMRGRLRAACEHFVDISREPDDVAAARLREDALDILVDLKGYTAGDRLTIMARRPCNVQVAWLGYPGTTGAPFVDYLIADGFIIPPGREQAYSERVVRLPHCYQANDRKRVPAAPLSRADYGIPDPAFVFCCFNQTYKITAEIFDVWMRLLRNVPDAVLWLVDSNPWARRNLTATARASGVSAERLIFAPRLPYASHLARYRIADLALDTYPYTSHTTASDALWCGCPVAALSGETFASRVSGSILTAAGLPDLVTRSFPDYEALASRLATDAPLLQEVRGRVVSARDGSVLFDSTGFTRDLERIYAGLAASGAKSR